MALSKGGNKGKSNVVDLFPDVSKSERIVMSLNASAVGKIMDRLTDLYNDPIQATVREIVSNALDTTAEARANGKNPQPVKISTPNAFDPVFSVEDNGMGMSKKIIKEVVAEYGASTKETSFNQVGAYGLGFKAPLAYCNEFYFTSTRDGETSENVISRLDTGPETNILNVELTNKQPGTLVKVPVRNTQYDFDRFKETIDMYKAYAFTMDEPIIIDEVEYSHNDDFVSFDEILIEQEFNIMGQVWFNKKNLSNVLKAISSYDYQKAELKVGYVLSGFLYNDPKGFNSYNSYGSEEHDLIVELKPGIVEFSSSRDQIMKDDRLENFDSLVKGQLFKSDYMFKNLVQYYKTLTNNYEAYEFSEKINYNLVDNKVSFEFPNNRFQEFSYSVDLKDLNTENSYNPFMENVSFKSEGILLGAVLPLTYDRKKFDLLGLNEDSKANDKLTVHSNLKISSANEKLEKQLHNSSSESIHFLSSIEKLKKDLMKYRLSNVVVISGVDNDKKVSSAMRNRNNLDSVSSIIFVKDTISSDLQKVIDFRLTDLNTVKFYDFETFSDHVKEVRKSKIAENSLSESGSESFTVAGKVIEAVNSLDELYSLDGGYANTYSAIEVDEYVEQNALFIPVQGRALYEIPSIINGVYHEEGDSLFGRSIVVVADPKKDFFDYVTDNTLYAFGPKYTARSKSAQSRLEGRVFSRDIVQDKISRIPEEERLAIYYLNNVHQTHYEKYVNSFIKNNNNDNPVEGLLKVMDNISSNVPAGSRNMDQISSVLTNVLSMEYTTTTELVNPSRVFSSLSVEVQNEFSKKLELIHAIKDPGYSRYGDSKEIHELRSMVKAFLLSKQDYLKEALGKRIDEIVGEFLEEDKVK